MRSSPRGRRRKSVLARAGAGKQQVQKPQEVGQAGWEENNTDAPAQMTLARPGRW